MKKERKPGEKFTEEAKPFVDQIRELASINYHKIVSLGHDVGQHLQKVVAPKLGIGGSTAPRVQKQPRQDDDPSDTDK